MRELGATLKARKSPPTRTQEDVVPRYECRAFVLSFDLVSESVSVPSIHPAAQCRLVAKGESIVPIQTVEVLEGVELNAQDGSAVVRDHLERWMRTPA